MILQTLGGLVLSSTVFRRPKLLLLLTYLILEGTQSRRTLAQLFWPDSADPAVNLRMALQHLRGTVPTFIHETDQQLRVSLGTDLEPLFTAARLGATEEVERLYVGPFLEGVHGAWGEELEEWVFRTREYVAGVVRDAFLRGARQAERAGETRRAAQLAASAVAVRGSDPTGIDDLPGVYRLLAQADHPSASEVRRLAGQLGLSLPVAVVAASSEASVLAESASAASVPAASARWPAPASPAAPALGAFVGRSRELGEVGALLATGTRLLTVVGPGGMGKSRLAWEVASGIMSAREGPQAFVSLEGLPDATLLVGRICDALGITPPMASEALLSLTRTLGSGPALLVLDNFEHLLPAGTELLGTLLQGCPGLRLLVTSREPLHLPHEQLYPLDGLDCGEAGDALALFALRARRVQPDFEVRPGNVEALNRICTLVGGSPLALELAAGWARTLPVDSLAGEISRSLDVLSSVQRGSPARHASLRAVFDHSWGLLSGPEQASLRQVSVFMDGFTREAARAVTGADLPVLASLVDKSLLRLTPEGRFQSHPLIHQFTAEHLSRHPQEEAAARQAHAEFYVQLTQAASGHLYGPDQVHWFGLLALDHANIRAATHWGLEHDRPGIVAEIQRAIWIYVWCREDHAWGYGQLMRALEHPGLTRAGRAVLIMSLGSLARIFSDPASATLLLDEAVELARAEALPDMLMLSLLNRGLLAGTSGQEQAARRDLEACLDVATGLGNPALESYAYTCLGEILNHQGLHQEAEHLLTLALHKARSEAGGWYLYRATLTYANHLRDRGELQAALNHYQTGLDQLGPLGRPSDLAECLAEQAQALYFAGQPQQAKCSAEGSLRRLRNQSVVDPLVAGVTLRVLADLALDEHRPAEAGAYLLQAAQTLRRTEADVQRMLLMPSFIRLHLTQGHVGLALDLLRAFDRFEAAGTPLTARSVPMTERLGGLRLQLLQTSAQQAPGDVLTESAEAALTLEQVIESCCSAVRSPRSVQAVRHPDTSN